ncbi:unnamed protein product [Camellia sinensis]
MMDSLSARRWGRIWFLKMDQSRRLTDLPLRFHCVFGYGLALPISVPDAAIRRKLATTAAVPPLPPDPCLAKQQIFTPSSAAILLQPCRYYSSLEPEFCHRWQISLRRHRIICDLVQITKRKKGRDFSLSIVSLPYSNTE